MRAGNLAPDWRIFRAEEDDGAQHFSKTAVLQGINLGRGFPFPLGCVAIKV